MRYQLCRYNYYIIEISLILRQSINLIEKALLLIELFFHNAK